MRTLLQGNALDSTQGGIAFCAVVLIRADDGRLVVVDPGCSGRVLALRAALDRLGLRTADIDTVVLTHAHWDHIQNLDLFERARVLVHADELAYVRAPAAHDFATPRWTSAVLEHHRVRPAGDGEEVAPGVSLMAAPGHSAGTMAVLCRTEHGVTAVAGDVVQTAEVAVSGRNALVFSDEHLAARSVAAVRSVADVIVPGHDLPFRLVDGRVEYVERAELTIFGPDVAVHGVRIAGTDPSA